MLPPTLGPIAYLICGAGFVWSVDLSWSGARRYGEADELLRDGDGRTNAMGAVVLRTAALTGACALGGLVFVFAS